MLNKVIEILDANSEETRHPQWGIVRLFTEDAILAAAEQILTLLQPNKDIQPQLQQTPCKTLLPPPVQYTEFSDEIKYALSCWETYGTSNEKLFEDIKNLVEQYSSGRQ